MLKNPSACYSVARKLLWICFAASAAACSSGDAPCFCSTVLKGTWLATPTTIRPLCRKIVIYQGLQRTVDIYLPVGFTHTRSNRYTPWIYLHGVHAGKWYLADNPVWAELSKTWPVPQGGNVQISDMGFISGDPILSNNTGSKVNSSANVLDGRLKVRDAILVVPEATGDVQKGQIWNSIFWRCVSAMSQCTGTDINDVGFIAYLIVKLQQMIVPDVALNKPFLTGYSNGAMLVQTLLCEQPDIVRRLSGIGILAGALGTKFAAAECQKPLPEGVPMLWVHGTADSTLPYKAGTSEGVDMLGAEAAVKIWAAHMGCPTAAVNNPKLVYQDIVHKVDCRDYCAIQPQQQASKQQVSQQHPVVLCSVDGGSHFLTRDVPTAGYAAGLLHWSMSAFEGSPRPLS